MMLRRRVQASERAEEGGVIHTEVVVEFKGIFFRFPFFFLLDPVLSGRFFFLDGSASLGVGVRVTWGNEDKEALLLCIARM